MGSADVTLPRSKYKYSTLAVQFVSVDSAPTRQCEGSVRNGPYHGSFVLHQKEKLMTNFKLMGVTALSLALAFATPALARGGGGGHGGGMGGGHGGGGFHGGGMGGGFHGGGFAGRGGYGHGYGRGLAFAGGLAVGSALGYGYGGYYGDGYYADNGYYDGNYGNGQPYVAASGPPADSAYCAQQYRSYDPASGTYLGYDGLRHPCG
jgi:hypothetical protein